MTIMLIRARKKALYTRVNFLQLVRFKFFIVVCVYFIHQGLIIYYGVLDNAFFKIEINGVLSNSKVIVNFI